MSDQVRALPKGLPAVSTLIPFLRPVDSLVSGKGRALLEALPTFSGMAGDLLSMAPLVSQECGAPAERLLAAKALGGFFAEWVLWCLRVLSSAGSSSHTQCVCRASFPYRFSGV